MYMHVYTYSLVIRGKLYDRGLLQWLSRLESVCVILVRFQHSKSYSEFNITNESLIGWMDIIGHKSLGKM